MAPPLVVKCPSRGLFKWSKPASVVATPTAKKKGKSKEIEVVSTASGQEEVSTCTLAGLDPEKVLEIFKALQKDGSLAKILADEAKKVPTSSSSDLDEFLSEHTPLTLRLRAHLFHMLSSNGGGGEAGEESALIEELLDPEADAVEDSKLNILAMSPQPDEAVVAKGSKYSGGLDSQRDHLILLLDVLLKTLADIGGAGGEAGGKEGELGKEEIRKTLVQTREMLLLSDLELVSSYKTGKGGLLPHVEQALSNLGAGGGHVAEQLMKTAREVLPHVPQYKGQTAPAATGKSSPAPKGKAAAKSSVKADLSQDKLVGEWRSALAKLREQDRVEREKELQLAFPRRKAKQVSASQAPTAVSLSLPLCQDPAVESPGDSAAPAIKGKISKSKKAGGAGVKQAAVADADTVDVMDVSGNVEEAEDAAVAARALAAVTHALVTRHAGFDGATGQAVSLLSALAANRMESMGAALRAAQPCMPASSSGAGFCAAACTVLPACLARARLCSLGAVQSEIIKLPPKMSAAAALAERNKVRSSVETKLLVPHDFPHSSAALKSEVRPEPAAVAGKGTGGAKGK